jgi:hypothetical protein
MRLARIPVFVLFILEIRSGKGERFFIRTQVIPHSDSSIWIRTQVTSPSVTLHPDSSVFGRTQVTLDPDSSRLHNRRNTVV